MNEEVAKAKEIAEGVLGSENFRQLSGFSTPLDLESYILKVNYLPFFNCGSILKLISSICLFSTFGLYDAIV